MTAWSRLLGSNNLAVRLFALRALSQLGPEGIEVLKAAVPRPGESYPRLWALARGGEVSLGSRLEHSSAVSLTVQRLVEDQGSRAFGTLLEILETEDEVKGECVAWAMGRLGEAAVAQILPVYPFQSARVRQHLAIALWYCGPGAEAALPLLLDDPSPQASAALLAMESAASRVCIERRRGPVWLDDLAVGDLAMLAFGDEAAGRLFACACLGGFGPAADRSLPILRHLSQDSEPEVRRMAARALGEGRRAEAVPILLDLWHDEVDVVCAGAARALEGLFDSPEQLRQALLHWTEVGESAERVLAAKRLASLGLPDGSGAAVAHLFDTAPADVLVPLLEAVRVSAGGGTGVSENDVMRLIASPPRERSPAVRRAAVRALGCMSPNGEVAQFLRGLVEDDDEEFAGLVAHTLLKLRVTRSGIPSLSLSQLPRPVLRCLLDLIRGDRLVVKELQSALLPYLKDPDPAVRGATAEALGGLEHAPPEILGGLQGGLKDPAAEVVLACGQALARLGASENDWVLLLSSPYSNERGRAYDALSPLAELPEAMLRLVRQGQLFNDFTLRLIEEKLSETQRGELLLHAFPHLTVGQRLMVRAAFGRLGLAGLAAVRSLLSHRDGLVRWQALSILEQFLEPASETDLEALIDSCLQLPFQDVDLQVEARLHHLLGRIVALAPQDPRLRPLSEELSRSPHRLARGPLAGGSED